jgi:long-chain acyl-CoA synthetase
MPIDHAWAIPTETALDDLSRQRTWAELADRVTRLARLMLGELGLKVGDHAAFLMENRVECVELTLAAIEAGIWMTPINHHLQAGEIAYVVRDSGARVVFVDPLHESTAGEVGAPRAVVAGAELDALVAEASPAAMPRDGTPGGTMIYTSGTSGYPKGVKRVGADTVGAALEAAKAAGAALGLDGSGSHLVTGPAYHAAPLLFAIYDLCNGAPVVILPRWDALEALRIIQERHIRHTHMVPTMFVRLLRLDETVRCGFNLSSLSLVLHGAAPVAPEVKRRMIEWWGAILVEYWGATEGGACTLVDCADWLAHPGTVGRPLPNWEVFAADDRGRRLPPGEVGLLYCRNRRLARPFEYHGDPRKTAGAFLGSDAFTTGDIGCVDADGYVHLTDRRSNVIISGGVNIYPAEVEQALQQHPAVVDAAVFGVPDEDWGETVKAAVELAPGYAGSLQLEGEVLAFLRTRLSAYKVPRSIDFEARLPRDPNGKLFTRLLRERYWQGRAKRI